MMKKVRRSLDELMVRLPADAQAEAWDFVEFLLQRQGKKVAGKPKFQWAGALKDLKGRYSSVDLQHEISKWRL